MKHHKPMGGMDFLTKKVLGKSFFFFFFKKQNLVVVLPIPMH